MSNSDRELTQFEYLLKKNDDSFVSSTENIDSELCSHLHCAVFIGVPFSYVTESGNVGVWENAFICTLDDTHGIIIITDDSKKTYSSHDMIIAVSENGELSSLPKYTFTDKVYDKKQIFSRLESINLPTLNEDEDDEIIKIGNGPEDDYHRRDNYSFENSRDLTGDYRLIVIAGKAGIGKTTLAKKLLGFNDSNYDIFDKGDIIINTDSNYNVILENFNSLSDELINWLVANIRGYVIVTTINKEIVGHREGWKVIELTSKPYTDTVLEHSRITFP